MDHLSLLKKDYAHLGEVATLIPHFDVNALFRNHILLILGNNDLRMGRLPSGEKNNIFVPYDNVRSLRTKYVVAMCDESDYANTIVEVSYSGCFATPTVMHRSNHTLQKILKSSKSCSLNEQGYMVRDGSGVSLGKQYIKFYVLYDDSDLSTLKILRENDLVSNIIHVDYVSPHYTLRERKEFQLHDDMSIIKSYSKKLTKEVHDTLAECGVDANKWYDTLEKLESITHVRVGFKFSDGSSNALKTLLNEMYNDVIPIGFNWSKDSSRVIGGTVMCPLSYLPRFDAKMKLLGKTYFNVAIDQENVIKKVFNEVTNDLQ